MNRIDECFQHMLDSFTLPETNEGYHDIILNHRAVISGLPSPVFNYLFLTSYDEHVIHALRDHQIPFTCFPTEQTQPEFDDFMRSLSLTSAGKVRAQAFQGLQDWVYDETPTITIEHVTTDEGLFEFDRISATTFDHPEGFAHDFLLPLLEHEHMVFLLARDGDKAVGCSIVSFANHEVGCYWTGVLKEYRNRGIASSLAKYRMHLGKERGHNSAIVHNQAMSIGYCQRLNFKPVGEITLYVSNTE